MAIPFNLPDYAEDNINDMDQLFLQLYNVLRQILFRRLQIPQTNQPPDGGGTVHPQAAANSNSEQNRLPLPDLVQTANRTVPTSRVRTRNRNPQSVSTSSLQPDVAVDAERVRSFPRCHYRRRHRVQSQPRNMKSVPEGRLLWVQVGEQLRRIADDFRDSVQTQNRQVLEDRSTKSVFSLFVPSFTGSILTAVAIFVGWRLLCRER